MTIEEAADKLGVSAATVNNWLRTGTLSSLDNLPDILPGETSDETSQKGRPGVRLVSRANKTARKDSLMPSGYAPGRESRRRLETILERIRESGVHRETALCACALRRTTDLFRGDTLEFPGLMISPADTPMLPAAIPPAPRRLLMEWITDLRRRGLIDGEGIRRVYSCVLPDIVDPLGAVLLGSLGEGSRVRGGIYFTPVSIIESVTGDYGDRSGNVLDPCCGTGQFLVHLARNGTRPEELWGIDLDPLAVRLASLNLSYEWPHHEGEFHIYHGDFLTLQGGLEGRMPLPTDLSLVVTNPPWGYRFDASTKKRLRAAYPELNTTESFSLVVARAIESLGGGGVGVFILPESFLTVRAHSGIRRWLLQRCDVLKTEYLGKPFSGVFTPVIRVDLRRRSRKSVREHEIRVIDNKREYRVQQCRLSHNADYTFDLHLTPRDRSIVDALNSRPHVTLQGNARWALGVVTGDNRRHILTEPVSGSEPVISGTEITPYRITPPAKHIVFRPQLYQQTADEALYRHPCKLVYRFIAREPVVALDYEGRISLNSANILIPELTGYTIEAIAALLNSSLYRFVYARMFSALKVLRRHLEALPLPVPDSEVTEKLDHESRGLIAGRGEQSKIDDLVFRICGISASDRAYIEDTWPSGRNTL